MKAMALTRHLPIGVTREIWIEHRDRGVYFLHSWPRAREAGYRSRAPP